MAHSVGGLGQAPWAAGEDVLRGCEDGLLHPAALGFIQHSREKMKSARHLLRKRRGDDDDDNRIGWAFWRDNAHQRIKMESRVHG